MTEPGSSAMLEQHSHAGTSERATGHVRPPAWAGSFYPDDANRLRQVIAGHLQSAGARLERAPKALIVPHAGYPYSGPVAASGFATLAKNPEIKTVVLLGPSHHVEFSGLALSGASAWATPLGEVPVDAEAPRKVEDLSQVLQLEMPHGNEHCLEGELPFLQVVLQAVQIIPLLVGEATGEEVAQVIERLWGGPETMVLISSDLSHYMNYDTAVRLDRTTANAIEQLHPEGIGHDQACGRLGIRGLLAVAQRKGLHCQTLDLRNSGDTSGRRDQVVGYGAFAFLEAERTAASAADVQCDAIPSHPANRDDSGTS